MRSQAPLTALIWLVLVLILAAPMTRPSDDDEQYAMATVDSCSQDSYPSADDYIAVDKQPEMTEFVAPDYPEMARMSGAVNAEVWIRVLVDLCGNVKKAQIQIPCNHKGGFNEKALEAAYKCRFKPALLDENPVAAWVTYKVEFKQ